MTEKTDSVVLTTPNSTWKGWLWDSADVSKEERRFILKAGSLVMLSLLSLLKLAPYSWTSLF
jgi:MFS transporter, ACS family, pantothenate transporter